jgi:hypothetical protein
VASPKNNLIHSTEQTIVFLAVCTLNEYAYHTYCIWSPSLHIYSYAFMKAYVCFTVSPVEKVYELMT